MKITRNDQQLSFEIEPWEREVLAGCFFALRDSYEIAFESLPPEAQRYWKGKIGMTPEEKSELETEQHFLEEIRQHWRDERQIFVERWVQELAKSPEASHWSLPLAEADTFLQILNDRRLLLAAQHQITETDMTRDLFQTPDSPKFRALGEIDFLAYIQSLCLRNLPL